MMLCIITVLVAGGPQAPGHWGWVEILKFPNSRKQQSRSEIFVHLLQIVHCDSYKQYITILQDNFNVLLGRIVENDVIDGGPRTGGTLVPIHRRPVLSLQSDLGRMCTRGSRRALLNLHCLAQGETYDIISEYTDIRLSIPMLNLTRVTRRDKRDFYSA